MKQEDVKRGRQKGMEAAGESGAPKHQDEGTMIAFFDVETTVPFGSRRGGGGYSLLEFGAILVCPRRLIEVDNFSTLVRPSDLKSISSLSIRCNGITRDSVSTAPYFADVADKVFSFLHGRVWAGHNILRFDCPRIREAFAEIGRPPPEPMGIIDTLPLLTERFGRRAGDMKMATLANYFCLGPQKHRSLDDVRLNLEVLKYCAAVLFLESSVSNVPFIKKFVSGSIISENCNIQKGIPVGKNLKLRSPPVPYNSLEGSSCWVNDVREERLELGQSDNPLENEDATSLIAQVDQMKIDSSHLSLDASEGGGNSAPFSAANSADTISSISTMKKSSSYAGFLEPDDVLVNCITVSHTTLSPTVKRIQILHLNVPLYLCCGGLMIHFGISTKFTDHAGRPKFSILVNAPPSLCHVLAICDSFVQNSLRSHGSTSEWWPLMKKKAYTNSSTVRLHIRSKTNCESAAMYYTEIYRIDASKNINKLVLSKFDAAELDLLLTPGTTIDAFFCLDAYDYQQNAGIRLVAKSLVVHSSLPGS